MILKKKDRKVPIRKFLLILREKDVKIKDAYNKRHPKKGKRVTIKSLITKEFVEHTMNKKTGIGLSLRDLAFVLGCSAGTVGQYVSEINRNNFDEALFEDIDLKEEIFGTPILSLNIEGIYEHENVFLMLSDIQAGAMVVADGFDWNPKDTVKTYFDNLVARLTETIIRRNMKVNTFNLIMLGDLVDGWLIYPKQYNKPLRQQVEMIVVNIMNLIRFIVENITPNVHIYGVYGNHGNNSHRHVSSDNWDMICMDTISVHIKYLKEYDEKYNLVKDYISDKEVQFHNIGEHRYAMQHGHQFGGFNTHGWIKQAKDLFISQGNFDALLMGHWHLENVLTFADSKILVNGCTYHSELVQWKLQGKESITQLFFGSDEYNPVAWVEFLDVDQGILVKE